MSQNSLPKKLKVSLKSTRLGLWEGINFKAGKITFRNLLNASDPFSLDLYRRTGEMVPKIRAIIGTDFKGISDFDWQLNAGAAQALRELES